MGNIYLMIKLCTKLKRDKEPCLGGVCRNTDKAPTGDRLSLTMYELLRRGGLDCLTILYMYSLMRHGDIQSRDQIGTCGASNT
jgi:hypothetical protein